MALIWTPSAAKHGIAREDALPAILNYQYRVEEFDEPRAGSSGRPDLFIGKTRAASMVLEVMAVITPPDGFVIFHVLKARDKILHIAEKEANDEHQEGRGQPRRHDCAKPAN